MQKNLLVFLFSLIVWATSNILGLVIAGAISYGLDPLAAEVDYEVYMKMAAAGEIQAPFLHIFLIITHGFSFIVPAIAIGLLLWKKDLVKNLRLNTFPKLGHIFWSSVVMVCILPLSFYFNDFLQGLNWPDWFKRGDGDAQSLMLALFKDRSAIGFILNIALIGVMAAVGEELLFRGVIQQFLENTFNNGHLAVLVTGIIFGLMHFQVDGLSVRIILGIVLGYALLYTRSLWLSIILHFLYNSFQVVMVYSLSEAEVAELVTDQGYSPGLLISLVILIPGILAFYLFRKVNNGQEST